MLEQFFCTVHSEMLSAAQESGPSDCCNLRWTLSSFYTASEVVAFLPVVALSTFSAQKKEIQLQSVRL